MALFPMLSRSPTADLLSGYVPRGDNVLPVLARRVIIFDTYRRRYMTDIVERLRYIAKHPSAWLGDKEVQELQEAADEIERLRAVLRLPTKVGVRHPVSTQRGKRLYAARP
jgi:hypothetical protein